MNIDLAPTFLRARRGLSRAKAAFRVNHPTDFIQNPKKPSGGDKVFLLSYYWEMAYQALPTLLLWRTEKYKYIFQSWSLGH